jgi:asparagine synthase (glutamine-hydrolysing)
MAHGLEAQVPLLDPRVVEFALSLPERLKVCGLKKEFILKRAMTSSLPERIRPCGCPCIAEQINLIAI